MLLVHSGVVGGGGGGGGGEFNSVHLPEHYDWIFFHNLHWEKY